jgi:hypothetical protein
MSYAIPGFLAVWMAVQALRLVGPMEWPWRSCQRLWKGLWDGTLGFSGLPRPASKGVWA